MSRHLLPLSAFHQKYATSLEYKLDCIIYHTGFGYTMANSSNLFFFGNNHDGGNLQTRGQCSLRVFFYILPITFLFFFKK